jgi:N-acetylglutamate synthase-like GNAT family acetyltransferase
MDKPSIEKFARDLIESPIGALFVTEKFGRLVAACGALVVPYHFNTNVLLAQGVFLWSDPQHKGTGHQVVFALERWAKDQGAQKVLLTTNDTLSGSESARGYLSRRGYIAEETNYVRTI